MEEQDQNSEYEEVTPQDQDEIVNDEISEDVDQREAVEDKQDRNWRELRKKQEETERELREERERSKMQQELIRTVLSQQSQQQQQAQQPEEVDEFADIDPKDYLPYDQSRKAWGKDARQIAREEYLALEKEREQLRFKDRLKAQYADFEQVVNDQTIALFDKQEPELAAIIAKNKDPYEMGLLAYHHIKQSGLVSKGESESIHSREVDKKLEKASKTVQSPATHNKRPIAAAFSTQYMTKEQKDELRKEMERCAAMSGGY